MSMDRPVVVLAAVLQAGAALVLLEMRSLGAAVLWTGLLGGLVVALASRRGDGHLRDGFIAGVLATALVVAGYYLLLDGLAVEMTAVNPEPRVVTGETATIDDRPDPPSRFPGSAALLGFVTAPVVGFANGVFAVLILSVRSGIAAFRRGMRDAR